MRSRARRLRKHRRLGRKAYHAITCKLLNDSKDSIVFTLPPLTRIYIESMVR